MTAKESAAPARGEDGDALERALAKHASWGLPALTVATAFGVGALFGVGPAILVLAAGALVGVIALLWASVRTLGGDAPLAEGLADAMTTRVARATDAEERKRRVLRALKDLEHEHAVGKIDDVDYARMSARYRDQAKAILREIDADVEPLRARAESIATAHLKKAGLAGDADGAASENSADAKSAEPATSRVACGKCATSNEPDAAFCKKCGTPLTKETHDATA
jgi:hypothetical protein